MAIIRAIRTGNWADTSTWDLGRVPDVDDEVHLVSYNVTVSLIEVNVASIYTESGELYINVNNIVINADFYGILGHDSICAHDFMEVVTINGNVTNFQSGFRYTLNYFIINGNVKNLYHNPSGSRGHRLLINGNVETLKYIGSTSGEKSIVVNGKLTIDDNIYDPNLSTPPRYEINGVFKINGNFTIDLSGSYNSVKSLFSGSLDLSDYDGEFLPFNSSPFSIENLKIIYKYQSNEIPPVDVVLEGYQYGDKVGTLKTVPDNVTIVNLTEQQLQRVGNCATVSTVQKCFEEFKE